MSYLDEIERSGRGANPFFCLMGIEPVSWDEGRACLKMTVRPDMTNGEGWLQGGMFTALADEAMALAIYTLLKEGEMIATISCTTHFMKGAREKDTIAAEASVTRRGRQIIFAEAVILFHDSRKELSRCSASFTVRQAS
jgi:uncharacterized protein (TIGR00369 family)